MINFLGKRLITDKEASARYGFSTSWFKLRRHQKLPPRFIKIHGKVFYDQDLLDTWFITQIKE